MLRVLSLVPTGLALAEETDSSSPSFGKKFFLWNALPGELIEEYKITKKKRSYCEAIAEKISPASLSPHRVEEKDPCFLSTSPWQIFSWDFELAEKRSLVEQSLLQEKIPLSAPVSPVITDHVEWRYRNKMEYSLYWDNSDNKIYLAFHQRGSHKKVPLHLRPACQLSGLCAATASSRARHPRRRTGATCVRQKEQLREASGLTSGENMLTLPSSLEHPKIAEMALKIVQELNSAHASARDYQSLLLRSNQQGIVSGGLLENYRPHPVFPNLTDTILGIEYSYSVGGFFQINLPVYELALTEIKNHITTNQVLDLYSGVGTIGLSVARDKNLTLVESNPSAFAELEANVSRLQSSSPCPSPIQPLHCKSEDALDLIASNQTVILDPPRAGCAPALINRLLEKTPEKIIYLSCNPSTQARDVAALLPAYSLVSITPFNFFPKTPHIENLIVLSRTT